MRFSQVATNYESWKLYRTILRNINKLPVNSQSYYREFSRQHFEGHYDEGEGRSKELIARGYENMKWVLAKYDVEYEPNH